MIMIVTLCTLAFVQSGIAQADTTWQDDFDIAKRNLASTGRSDYFVLEPGFQLTLEGRNTKLVITVLDETKHVVGVTTRVVEEREWKNGKLIEVSRNYFAFCEKTKDVLYFGEHVDNYKNGKVINHNGTWLAGTDGARVGMMVPGEPKVGMRFYQEIAPGVAMDRSEILSLDNRLETPAGSFSNCLKAFEGTALNPREKQFKYFAPEIGLIRYEDLRLTKYGFITKE